jgi:hypothetical protein
MSGRRGSLTFGQEDEWKNASKNLVKKEGR